MSKPTFPDVCTDAIFAAKAKAQADGPVGSFTKKDVRAVIKIEWLKELGRTADKAGANIPPSPAEVTAYAASIGWPMDGEAWCISYAQKGWKVGKTRMVNWQAAVQNWKKNAWKPGADENAKPVKKEKYLA